MDTEVMVMKTRWKIDVNNVDVDVEFVPDMILTGRMLPCSRALMLSCFHALHALHYLMLTHFTMHAPSPL